MVPRSSGKHKQNIKRGSGGNKIRAGETLEVDIFFVLSIRTGPDPQFCRSLHPMPSPHSIRKRHTFNSKKNLNYNVSKHHSPCVANVENHNIPLPLPRPLPAPPSRDTPAEKIRPPPLLPLSSTQATSLRAAAIPLERYAALPRAAREVVRVPSPARADQRASAVRHTGLSDGPAAAARAPPGLLQPPAGAR